MYFTQLTSWTVKGLIPKGTSLFLLFILCLDSSQIESFHIWFNVFKFFLWFYSYQQQLKRIAGEIAATLA